MIEADLPEVRPPRRMSVVARALRPMQREIGMLQERLAFLTAKKLFALRKDGTTEIEADLDQCTELVGKVQAELEVVVARLPPKALADSRMADTRLALEQALRTISSLAGPASRA